MKKASCALIALVLSLALAVPAQAVALDPFPGTQLSADLDFTVNVVGTYLDQINMAATPTDVAGIMSHVMTESPVPGWAYGYWNTDVAHRHVADQLICSQAKQEHYADLSGVTATIGVAIELGAPDPALSLRRDTAVPEAPWGTAYVIAGNTTLISSTWAAQPGNSGPRPDGTNGSALRVYNVTTQFDITPVNVGKWAYRVKRGTTPDADVWDALLLSATDPMLYADIASQATTDVYYKFSSHWCVSEYQMVADLPDHKQVTLAFDAARAMPVLVNGVNTFTVAYNQPLQICIALRNHSPVAIQKAQMCIQITDSAGQLIDPTTAGLTILAGGQPVSWDGQYCHPGPDGGTDLTGFCTQSTFFTVTVATPGTYRVRMAVVKLP